jgi:hypothetical protein
MSSKVSSNFDKPQSLCYYVDIMAKNEKLSTTNHQHEKTIKRLDKARKAVGITMVTSLVGLGAVAAEQGIVKGVKYINEQERKIDEANREKSLQLAAVARTDGTPLFVNADPVDIAQLPLSKELSGFVPDTGLSNDNYSASAGASHISILELPHDLNSTTSEEIGFGIGRKPFSIDPTPGLGWRVLQSVSEGVNIELPWDESQMEGATVRVGSTRDIGEATAMLLQVDDESGDTHYIMHVYSDEEWVNNPGVLVVDIESTGQPVGE